MRNMHPLCIPIFYMANHKSHSLSPPRFKTRSYHMRESKYTSYNSTSTCTVIIPHTHRTIALYVRSIISSNNGIPPLDSLYVHHSVIATLVSPLLLVFGQIWNGIYPVHRQYRRFETTPRDNKVSIHSGGGLPPNVRSWGVGG